MGTCRDQKVDSKDEAKKHPKYNKNQRIYNIYFKSNGNQD